MKKQPQQPLSPEKYIQTRARKLPVYKCFVNLDWQESRMANVFVTRRHTNGNLTVGCYLVDLLCLGVKDTFFWFSEPEQEVTMRVMDGPNMEIDYNLAHNIVFAGHDFALDYGIDPVKEFALTRLLLEEDTDDIPLLDITVGGPDGKPHLMVYKPGQYSAALAALRKNAGEGGYHYTVSAHFGLGEGEEYEEDDLYAGLEPDDGLEADDDFFTLRLDDVPLDMLTPSDARSLSTQDLGDEEKVEARTPFEQQTLQVELLLRLYLHQNPEYDVYGFAAEEEEWLEATKGTYMGLDAVETAAFQNDRMAGFKQAADEMMPLLEAGGEPLQRATEAFVKEAGDNTPHILGLYSLMMSLPELLRHQTQLTETLAHQGAHLPLIRLTLALGATLYMDVLDAAYADIYAADGMAAAFPGPNGYHEEELLLFWLSKMAVALREKDLPSAIQWYYLAIESEAWDWDYIVLQAMLGTALMESLADVLKGDFLTGELPQG